jgi:hypothetical protein
MPVTAPTAPGGGTVRGEPCWTCPTCRLALHTPFCAHCGEEPLPPHDLTLRGLGDKVVHALTSIDAKAARSAWALVRHPGSLTAAWTSGVRKPYVAPFQLFLIANVLFFAVQSLTGENVFSSPLASHLHQQDWSDLARSLLADHLAAAQVSFAQYQPIFDRAVVLNAKSLVLLMTVPFALLLPLAFMGSRRPFMTHVVFSIHLYTFLLLVFSVTLLAAKLSDWAGLGGLQAARVDNVLSLALLAIAIVYLHRAIGVVYGAGGAARAAKAVALAIAVAVIVVGYRFLLFLITLYGT